jgi:prophage regulatory protein
MVLPSSRRILRLPAVLSKTGVCADTVYRWARNNKFPKPTKLGERASGWFEDEIDAWLEQRATARNTSLTTVPRT